MRSIVKFGLCGAVAAATAAGWVALKPASVPAVVKAVPPVPVVFAMVKQEDVPIILNGLGTVQAENSAVIRSRVMGILQSVNFVGGHFVHRGDLLAQVDPRPSQAALDQAVAQLERDQSNLLNAQVNLSRDVSLLSRGFATEQQVTNEKSQISQLQSSIKSDQAGVENAKTQLSYTSLVAPFDGVTGLRLLDVGNIVQPTDPTGIVILNQVQPITVQFTLPSAAIPDIQDAMSAGMVEAIAFDQTGTRQLDTGRLSILNNQADPQSGTVQLKAQFPNVGLHLWPGTFVNVELRVRTVKDGLVIPTDAVQQGPDGVYVFVVGADHKVSAQPITLGQRLHGQALVIDGLMPGQTVVEQGQYGLAEGTVVVGTKPAEVANNSSASSGLLP